MLELRVVKQLHLAPIKKQVLDRQLQEGGRINLLGCPQAVCAGTKLSHCCPKPGHSTRFVSK